jgi:hypothetical protein
VLPISGVPPQVVDAAFLASRELRAMLMDEKWHLPINGNNIGYFAAEREHPGRVHRCTRPPARISSMTRRAPP